MVVRWQCRIWFAHQTKQIPFRLHRSHTSVAVRTHPLRLHTRTRVPPSRPFIFSPPNRVRFCIINLYSEYNFYFGFREIYNDAIDALRNWYMVSTDTHNTQHQQKKKTNNWLPLSKLFFFLVAPLSHRTRLAGSGHCMISWLMRRLNAHTVNWKFWNEHKTTKLMVMGEWTRSSFPFSEQRKNENCSERMASIKCQQSLNNHITLSRFHYCYSFYWHNLLIILRLS